MQKKELAGPGLRVLCVHPDDKVSGFLIRLLNEAGHRADRAENGEEGWTKLAQNLNYFEVVVTAHRMPKLDGLGLVERLRNAHYPGRLVVLGETLSSKATGACRRLAVDVVLSKRARADKLLRALTVFHTARWAAPSG